MESIAVLRTEVVQLFQRAVQAADPALALRQAFNKEASNDGNKEHHPLATKGQLILFSIGKAAVPMMREALAHLPTGQDYQAITITNYENGDDVTGSEIFVAAHPVPDDNGARAAERLIALLKNANETDRVIGLISGGASALVPAPVKGIDLADKSKINDIMMCSGFDIYQLNLVRQQISRLKGGGLNAIAAPAAVKAYILSDVIGDDLNVIASGPTAAKIGTTKDALKLLTTANIQGKVPPTILRHLKRGTPSLPPITAQNSIIGSNKMSLDAVVTLAKSNGWQTTLVTDKLIGNVEDAAETVATHISNTPANKQRCLVFGGETSVHVKGDGKGGRNQELALRVALHCQDLANPWVFLSGGTDGRDGPTDAAGGVVDNKSCWRITEQGATPNAFLSRSDSYHALESAKDLLITGTTGTNVADIQIALIP